MTRYLLAAATVAGALSLATPATACELQYCTWSRPVCNLNVVDCADPVWIDYCIDLEIRWYCV